MKRTLALATALALSCAGAFAEETVKVEKSSSTDGSVQKSTTVESGTAAAPGTTIKSETTKESSTAVAPGTVTKTSSSSSYTTRLESAYRNAGVADTEIVKLRDIDMKVMEARKANDMAKVKEYYTQQTRILKPEQVTKVRTYLTEHPVAVSEPRHYVSSYETVDAPGIGVSVNSPIGGATIGVPAAGGTVVEKKTEVAPANP